MPFLSLHTNIVIQENTRPKLVQDLSQLVAKETGKPESYVMIEVSDNMTMLFAGTNLGTAFLALKSIGLSATQCKSLSKVLCQTIENELKISANRIYIEFANSSGSYWGWNHSTFG